MDALQETPVLSTFLDLAEDAPRENWDDDELDDDSAGEDGESDADDDWDDDEDDWDDDEDDWDDDEDEEASDDLDEEDDWDDDEWDDDVPLESRFRALTSFDDEERIRKARPASDSAPRRDQVNRPARGGVRRDARPERDDDAGTD